jgi:hypothetical protein
MKKKTTTKKQVKQTYYWISGMIVESGSKPPEPREEVTTEHPFKRKSDSTSQFGKAFLLNWRPITKAEYNLYKKLFKQ